MKDYYSLLGIDMHASKADVKKNYRKLVTKFHPDKNSAIDAASKFIAITEAYEVLSDKKRRAQYDLMRWEMKKRKQEIDQNFTVVKPPLESLRTRRRKAQHIRGLAFQRTKSRYQKWFQILRESFLVSGRYILHLIGIILLLVIFYSAISQLKEAFEISTFVGVGICLFSVALLYFIYKLGYIIYDDYRQDIKTFSILFSLNYVVTMLWSITTFVFILLSIFVVLKAF